MRREHQDAYTKLPSFIHTASGVLKGATGVGYADAVWITSLEVGEARAGSLLVIAHDAGLKGADALLGRDFLVHFNVTIDPKERVVTLAPE